MNEAETRPEHIDPALESAGWGVVEGSKILRRPALHPWLHPSAPLEPKTEK